MERNHTELLLVATYQNTCTAIQSIENCFDDISNEDLKKELCEERQSFVKLNDEIEKIADKLNVDLKDNNLFEKARLWTSIKVSTLVDKTTRHYAELFFIGNNMGVFNMICAICDNKEADKIVIEKASELLKYEENYAIEMKHFFC